MAHIESLTFTEKNKNTQFMILMETLVQNNQSIRQTKVFQVWKYGKFIQNPADEQKPPCH